MIKSSVIDEIKNRMDIVDVVGDFVNLKKSGSSYKALSPFTNEKTPSFFVVPSKGIFKCFSSGKGGDAIRFIMEVDGLNYIEALKFLASKYGIEIEEEEQTDFQIEQQNKRDSLFIILNFAFERYKDNLHNTEEGTSIGLTYFRERGFKEDIIKNFGLGYSINKWDDLYKAAIANGYEESLLIESGLLIEKENDKKYDRFRGRVMFPIQNLTGKVIGFGARILSNDKKQPKYLNSPESELYNKSKVLYGIYQAKQSIRTQDRCYIVEGYTDVLSLHQAGVENVVASSGTALTSDQSKLIKRYSENVTVLFDGDRAGINASMRGINILLEEGLNVSAVTLPEGEDPDSYSKKLNTTAFRHFLEAERQDFISFKTSMLVDESQNDPIKKAGIIRDIVESISKISDEIKRSLYLKQTSDQLEIEENVLLRELQKILKEANKSAVRKSKFSETTAEEISENAIIEPSTEISEDKLLHQTIAQQEKETIRLLLNYGLENLGNIDEAEVPVMDYLLHELSEVNFEHPIYNRILKVIIEKFNDNERIDYSYFLNSEDEDVLSTVIELTAVKYEISEQWKSKYQIHVPDEVELIKSMAFTNVLRLKFRIIQQMILNTSQKLKLCKPEETDSILDEITDLKKIEVKIAEMLGNVTAK